MFKKDNQSMELLTSELYQKISGDKRDKIVALKDLRAQVLEQISDERDALSDLEEQKAELESRIRLIKSNLDKNKSKKFKLTREIGVQKRLANKINKLFTKDNSYVDVDTFYPEIKVSKKR